MPVTELLVLAHFLDKSLHISHDLVSWVLDIEGLHEPGLSGVLKEVALGKSVEVGEAVDPFVKILILVVVEVLRDAHFESPDLVANKFEVFLGMAR